MSTHPVAEYIQEEGTRSAQIFTSENSDMVIVLYFDGEEVVEDHICEDFSTAEAVASEWVDYVQKAE